MIALGLPTSCFGDKPNIILILADDFGWGDASCNNPETPLKPVAIDRIANEASALRRYRHRRLFAPQHVTDCLPVATHGGPT